MEAQIEKAIELREKANFKILTRLAQIIECSPHLRFQQILSNYKVCELGKDKFYEESIETLRNLEEQERISQLKITLPTNLLGIFEEIRKQGDPSSK